MAETMVSIHQEIFEWIATVDMKTNHLLIASTGVKIIQLIFDRYRPKKVEKVKYIDAKL